MFPSKPDVIDSVLLDILNSSQIVENPTDSFEAIIGIFQGWIDIGNLEDQNIATILNLQYIMVSRIYLQNPRGEAPAIALLRHGWASLGSWQKSKGLRVYRAAIAVQLSAIYYYYLNDPGAATWWALLTQADDNIGGFGKGGTGRDTLRTLLDVPNSAIEALRNIGLRHNSDAQASVGGWSLPRGFAEDVVTEFAITLPEYSHLLAKDSSVIEYPISSGYYEGLLADFQNAQSEGHDHKKKKESFERLAAYLFLLIPGCIPLIDVKDEDQTYETDLVIRNLNPNNNLMAEVFGRYFVAECKNWDDKVGVPTVGYFLHRIRLSHASFGVLFAKNGITGEGDEERAARQLIRRSFHEDNTICIVLGTDELNRLKTGDTTFRSILFELSERFRFGR